MALIAGDLLQGRFRVGAPLGHGGMGSVFAAREEPEGSELVVKQLRLDAPELLEAFRGEFALLSRITHPHLLRVIDSGSERLRGEMHHYYVADRIEGVTLGTRARRGAPIASLLRATLDAVSGLMTLHQAGIRHGDFTPENVLVDGTGRGVLIDLGCARPFGTTPELAGTKGYLAPELLEGRPGDARSDLFGVGRCLEELLRVGGHAAPAQLAKVLPRLLRPDPEARPADCAELLEALGRAPRAMALPRVPVQLLGRDTELARFEAWLTAFAAGDTGPRAVVVTGAAGMGSSRLMRELTWRAQLRVSVLRGGSSQPLGRLLAVALGVAEAVSSRRALLSAISMLTERSEALLLVVEDVQRLDAEQRELVHSLVRSLEPRGNLGLLMSARTPPSEADVLQLTCEPMPPEAVAAWASPWLTDKRVRQLQLESGGSPQRIEAALRGQFGMTAGARGVVGPGRQAAVAALSAEGREVLALLFARDGEAIVPAFGLDWHELLPLLEQGLVKRDGERLQLPAEVALALEGGALGADELLRGHLRAADWLVGSEQPQRSESWRSASAIRHLVLAKEIGRAQALFVAQQAQLAQGPRALAELLVPLARAGNDPALLLALAALLIEQGLPRPAVTAASRAARLSKRGAVAHSAALLVGDALVLLGRPARAELILGRLSSGAGTSDAASEPQRASGQGAELLQRLARARLSRGDYLGARSTAQAALEQGPTPFVAGLLRETLGVACAYLGENERAEQELHAALSLLGDAQRPRERSRIQSHRAMVAFRTGRVEAALANYAAALTLAEDHDQDDLIATGLLNLGTAEQQAGSWGSALRHYERGVRLARALGRISTELTLEFNLANLYSEIGALERAEQLLLILENKARAARLAHFSPSIALVRAEVLLARGDADAAEQLLLAAEQQLDHQPRELLEVGLRRIDVELLRNKPHEAERKLEALAGSVAEQAAEDLSLSLEQARARVAVALGRPAALEKLEAARQRAQQRCLLGLEATLETELFLATERLGRLDEARTRSERARRLWDRIGSELPAGLISPFWGHPRRVRLLDHSRPVVAAASVAATPEAEAYRRLLSLNRRLNSSLSLERVLEYAVQAALDLTGAERGFLVLAATQQVLQPKVAIARSTEPTLPEGEGPSQSIVARTLEREEAILTTDAQGDPRFAGQGSVHALRLKSVLSVPILSPSGVLGVLYVDCRVQRARFTEAERSLLAAFADQLAIAISNARLHQELGEQRAELERQKHAVEQLSRGQAREIDKLKRQVEAQRETLELRYDYAQIVGRGPAMRAVLERLDRVIDSEASVLVLGESGTGKELVARAIHWNGPRKTGPFLGINCAALPETLLESELFGHVRGAFTGADRDKVGLMLAASGGTLFLDELGELSPATQAKLLRVLQEREVRPLGAERARPLDVRLIAATHRDLQEAMASGRFREDLYYRLAVVTVALPPLRDRPEDLPALCEKILERLAREAGKPRIVLGQDALRRLAAYNFPGNVRELENVLTRAFVLASGPKLGAENLELGARQAVAPRARSRRDFETDERQRILSALRQSRWNVSVVARSLGIPRNTLYRKLSRYGLQRSES